MKTTLWDIFEKFYQFTVPKIKRTDTIGLGNRVFRDSEHFRRTILYQCFLKELQSQNPKRRPHKFAKFFFQVNIHESEGLNFDQTSFLSKTSPQ